jgi:pimeloyl-ACP methyl ester carboxylesterase
MIKGISIVVFLLTAVATAPQALADCVILLHGLARTSSSMEKLESALATRGYRVANVDYPSRKHRIEKLAPMAIERGIRECHTEPHESIHFVTHSLGGILVRYYFASERLPNLGRVVMLGPPNKGSEVVDELRDVPGFSLLNGPAGSQLGTDVESIPSRLGPVDYPVGIVAGTRTINLILSAYLPNPDDGKVSTARTKVDGMSDYIEMPVSHPFLMRDDAVIAQVLAFIETGAFRHGPR